jgi:aspartokinase
MIVRKFGGSSMIQLDMVASILDKEAQQGDITVVSAFKGVTDLLIKCAKRAYYSVDYSGQFEEIKKYIKVLLIQII